MLKAHLLDLIPCNESHRHAEIDFRNGYKNGGVCPTDHLVNTEESFIMSYKGIGKNGCQILADSDQNLARDISCNNIFNLLVAGKDILVVNTVFGFEEGITEEIDAFMMTFKEQGTLLYYFKSSLNNDSPLFA